jgi:hypothetical protein
MDLNFKKQSTVKVRMRRREFQRVDVSKPGAAVCCDKGVLWITQPGDNRDYILLPGDKLVVGQRGKVFIEAMRDADLHLA